MSALGSPSPLFLASAAAAAAAGPIKSVRFNDDDSANLTRTFSTSSSAKWTWSGWVKRCKLGANQALLSAGSYTIFGFNTLDNLRFERTSNATNIVTAAVFRDLSAWYHIVLAADSAQSTASDKVKLYVNGSRITSFSTATHGGPGTHINTNIAHSIGKYASSRYLDGYLADVYFIDGQQLEPTSFGEFDSNGVWQAIDASSLTFGSNGFHLFDFANESTVGHDSSGNDNDFTANNIDSVGAVVGQLYKSTSLYTTRQDVISNATAISGGSSLSGSEYLYIVPNGSETVGADVFSSAGSVTNAHSSNVFEFLYYSGGAWNKTSGSYNNTDWTSFDWGSVSSNYQLDPQYFYTLSAANQTPSVQGGTAPTLKTIGTASDLDVLFDVPTNGTQSDTGAGGEVSGNYATLNANITATYISSRTTLSNGNLQFVNTQYSTLPSTIAMSSGKWYCEGTLDALASASNQVWAGLLRTDAPNNAYEYFQGNNPTRGVHFWGDNTGLNRAQSYGASYATAGTVIGIAFDADAGSCTWYINGSSQGASTYNIVQGEEYYFSFGAYTNGAWTVNFGQRAFAYSAPSGYKALCTTNLPDPTITDGSTAFDAVTYAGTDSAQTISGLNLSPDFLWLKNRTVGTHHLLYDIVRGNTKYLQSSNFSAQGTHSSTVDLTGFTSDGFTLGGNVAGANRSSSNNIAWAWDAGSSTVSNTDGDVTSSVRANQSAGFSIVKWNPSSNGQSVGHGLNAVPEFIMAKALSNGHSWRVYHKSLTSGKNLLLDQDDPEDTYSADIDTVSSTVFDGGQGLTGSSLNDNIAYCFTSVAGYSAFGQYTGDGLAIGPFIYLGFRPAWIRYKAIDENSLAADWYIRDYKRLGFNHSTDASNNPELEANAPSTENNGGPIDMLSNGFKIRTNNPGHNTSGKKYMYAAFAENPFQANGGLAR